MAKRLSRHRVRLAHTNQHTLSRSRIKRAYELINEYVHIIIHEVGTSEYYMQYKMYMAGRLHPRSLLQLGWLAHCALAKSSTNTLQRVEDKETEQERGKGTLQRYRKKKPEKDGIRAIQCTHSQCTREPCCIYDL